MVIDSHLHVWERKAGHYRWLVPEFGELYDDFPPEVAADEVARAGVDGAILVQADDTLEDAHYLFDVTRRYDWALGAVVWLPLDAPDTAASVLDGYLANPTMCGVRQLVHDDPRDNFYQLGEVQEVAQLLSAHSVPLDIPDAWPRDLPQVVDLAARHPQLTVVLDHLGKPPVEAAGLGNWRAALRAFADNPNTVVKFSGLHHPDRPFTVEGVRDLWEVSLELFGPTRMMVGSDWPITVRYGGFQPTWRTIQELLESVPPEARRAIGSGTAQRVYGRSAKLAAMSTKEDN